VSWDFVYITADTYTNDEIRAMEALMLNAFKSRITTPTVLLFTNTLTQITHADTTVQQLTQFYAESMLQEYSMLRYRPSMVAAAAVAMARKTVGKTAWNSTLEKHSLYSESDVAPCLKDMMVLIKPENGSGACWNQSAPLTAVMQKFPSTSTLALAWAAKEGHKRTRSEYAEVTWGISYSDLQYGQQMEQQAQQQALQMEQQAQQAATSYPREDESTEPEVPSAARSTGGLERHQHDHVGESSGGPKRWRWREGANDSAIYERTAHH
jgi:hypothetical protein